LLVVILNNCGYMAMKRDHKQAYPDGWAACHNEFLGVNITPSPDYSKLAEVFGGIGERLSESGEIGPTFRRALERLNHGQTTLLDVIINNP
jgi:acetolactate synthase I/II/III large subunit